ncbi:MAG: adenosylcobinamide-GDP ribazoletransferase [Eubacteriales bacterium]|nr:adenosylcobinamide-GDP ribazoletransferase [Eubacteriales bacterium]
MKKYWESFKIAFSMFSKIPMPESEWTEENMEYTMLFFPFVGTVTGLLLYAAALALSWLGLARGQLFRVAVLTLLPLIVTGGIHLDGFLDVSDAMSSWQERDRRLEILKDSHAGAFAIIRGIMFIILYMGAVSLLEPKTYVLVIFALTMNRACIAYTVVTWDKARPTGTVAAFSRAAGTRVIQVWSVFLALVSLAATIGFHMSAGVCVGAALIGTLLYYRHLSYHYFGGINGDLAGWCNEVSELVMLLALALLTAWRGGSLWS